MADKYYRISLNSEKIADLSENIILPPIRSLDSGAVIALAESMFAGKTDIKSVIIPDGVTHIMDKAFSGCTGLTEITIPASVKSMGKDVFDGCNNLVNIISNKTASEIGANPNWNSNWLGDCTGEVNYITTYTITFEGWENGTITANKNSAKAGEEIQLTVEYDPEKYSVNWVKYNGKILASPYKFIMPAENVEITAEFVAVSEPDTPTTYASINIVAPDKAGSEFESQTVQYNTEQHGYYFEIGSKITTFDSVITSQYPLVIEYYDNLTSSWILDEAAGGWKETFNDNVYTYTETANTDIAGPIQQRARIQGV